ncbi:MAG: hypothetical protein Q8N28_00195 [bacterium]|nr:hypothetical protein [bacterium]
MDSRLAKQIFYAACYLSALFLMVFIIYLIWFKPAATCFDNRQNQSETGIDCGGPCQACEIKTLILPEVSWLKYFPTDSQTVIAAEIKNSNLNYAADYFSYTVDVYDNGGVKIKSLMKNSFIYAGEIKYLVEPVEIDSKKIKEIKISFSNINWKLNEEFKKPITQLREIKTESTAVSGFITNNNAFRLSKIRIFGFLYNQYGILISASKTELENVPAFEEKFFKINFPKNTTDIDSSKTKVYAEAIR